MARLQSEDFDLSAQVRRLKEEDRRAGAVVAFLGTVKEISRGETIEKLEFESYGPMALKELEKLEREARERFDILKCDIIHRTGRLAVGDNIVMIAVSSVSRAAAFDACEWAIDELKRRVPIWKKEFAESGSRWVEERP
ncbi:MAG: molybdenum cofactor biosynthesis protein MoaE [Candidatus Nitrospinota bacterium M3_3B_026]